MLEHNLAIVIGLHLWFLADSFTQLGDHIGSSGAFRFGLRTLIYLVVIARVLDLDNLAIDALLLDHLRVIASYCSDLPLVATLS